MRFDLVLGADKPLDEKFLLSTSPTPDADWSMPRERSGQSHIDSRLPNFLLSLVDRQPLKRNFTQ